VPAFGDQLKLENFPLVFARGLWRIPQVVSDAARQSHDKLAATWRDAKHTRRVFERNIPCHILRRRQAQQERRKPSHPDRRSKTHEAVASVGRHAETLALHRAQFRGRQVVLLGFREKAAKRMPFDYEWRVGDGYDLLLDRRLNRKKSLENNLLQSRVRISKLHDGSYSCVPPMPAMDEQNTRAGASGSCPRRNVTDSSGGEGHVICPGF
jgi:hypothetical protein